MNTITQSLSESTPPAHFALNTHQLAPTVYRDAPDPAPTGHAFTTLGRSGIQHVVNDLCDALHAVIASNQNDLTAAERIEAMAIIESIPTYPAGAFPGMARELFEHIRSAMCCPPSPCSGCGATVRVYDQSPCDLCVNCAETSCSFCDASKCIGSPCDEADCPGPRKEMAPVTPAKPATIRVYGYNKTVDVVPGTFYATQHNTIRATGADGQHVHVPAGATAMEILDAVDAANKETGDFDIRAMVEGIFQTQYLARRSKGWDDNYATRPKVTAAELRFRTVNQMPEAV